MGMGMLNGGFVCEDGGRDGSVWFFSIRGILRV